MAYKGKDFNSNDLIFLFILYQLYWLTTYFELSIIYKYLVVAVSILYQFSSFKRALSILLLSLFIPFISSYIGTGVFRLEKIFSLIFIVQYLNSISYQRIKIKYQSIIIFWILFLNIMQTIFLYMYPNYFPDPISFKNTLALLYKCFIIYLLFLAVFKKIDKKDSMKYILQLLFFYSFLMGCSIIHMLIDNPQEIYYNLRTGIMWSNEYFLHKNTWGLHYAILSIILFYFINQKDLIVRFNKKYLYGLLFFSISILLLSLSRRALIVFIFSIPFLLKQQLSIRYFGLIFIIIFSLFYIQPDFLIERYDTMIASRSFSDLQGASAGQLSDRAIDQIYNWITLIPGLFTMDWEYNYMEGFYGQLLFRVGIIGFILHIIFLLLLRSIKPKYFSDLYILFIYFFIFAAVGYRHAFFCDIYGHIGYVNYLINFFLISNLIRYKDENLINE
tara:strand:+ start:17317 stop:18651 length:1335 start_codon:yes stop_codon:yes gene_type:complete